MNWSDHTPYAPPDAWLDDRLEAYLDGDLPPEDVVLVEQLLDADEANRAALTIASAIQQSLRTTETPPVPARLTAQIMANARAEAHRSARTERRVAWQRWWRTQRDRLLSAEAWRPALAMATLVLMVMLAARIAAPPPPSSTYSDADVEVAMEEVKLALAYLSEIGRRTGTTVRQDVLEQNVMLPIHHALGDVRTERAN